MAPVQQMMRAGAERVAGMSVAGVALAQDARGGMIGWLAGAIVYGLVAQHAHAGRPAHAQHAPKAKPRAAVDGLRLQVALDRAGFSVGEIDGRPGGKTTKALHAFQQARGLSDSAAPNAATWTALAGGDAAPVAATVPYVITAEDVAGPFLETIPKGAAQQAELPALGYTSIVEMLAERFHVSPALLRRLNTAAARAAAAREATRAQADADASAKTDANAKTKASARAAAKTKGRTPLQAKAQTRAASAQETYAVGSTITVPNVEPMTPPTGSGRRRGAESTAPASPAAGATAAAGKATTGKAVATKAIATKAVAAKAVAAKSAAAGDSGAAGPVAVEVVVSKKKNELIALDAQGAVIFYAPVSSGSSHDPLPLGDWTVRGVYLNPRFFYNPDLFWDADAKQAKVQLAAGANNPVGFVWIDLDRPHYGLHGTPEPSMVGVTQSHGCVRLTNWDIVRLAALVQDGTHVSFRP
jgi:lipoprotein-anchoring transpeptidase ErfK/SrfK